MPDRTDEYRDDTALGGTGPLTQSLDNWQPVYVVADMPLPHEAQIDQLYDKALAAHARDDKDAVMQVVGQMAALRNTNSNSGAVAPIQGQE